nr:hypothetical protein [Tanacetum cinerariifolium]
MEDMMLELLEEVKNIIEQPTKRETRIAESLQNFRVKKSSTSLNNTSQISSVNAITPVLPTEEPKYSLSMRYEHLSTPPETKSEILKSSVEKLVPIPNECEVTSDNEKDKLSCEDHSEILSDSNTDDISSNDDAFEDIEYVEASPLDSELVSLEKENDERLTSVDISDDSINDPLLEEDDLSFPRPPSEPPDVEFFFDLDPIQEK